MTQAQAGTVQEANAKARARELSRTCQVKGRKDDDAPDTESSRDTAPG